MKIKAVNSEKMTKIVQRLVSQIETKSSADHNHNNSYSAKVHTHSAADIGAAVSDHNHDEVYLPKIVEAVITAEAANAKASNAEQLATNAFSASQKAVDEITSHTHTAADVGAATFDHNHDEVYATKKELGAYLTNVLQEDVLYGDSLPDPGTPGRIFFKKVSS